MKGKTKRKTSVLLAVLLAVLMIVSFATLNLSGAKSQNTVFAADEATLSGDWQTTLGLKANDNEKLNRVTHVLVNVNMDPSTDFTQPQYTSVGENVYATLVDNGEVIPVWDSENDKFDETQTTTGLTVTFYTKTDKIYLPQYSGYLFAYMHSVKDIDVAKFDTSSVTSMYAMSLCCDSLTTLDVSDWNTSSVTGMGSMFLACHSLTTLNVSNWNTSNVTDMSCMFCECTSLSTLDVSGWDTSKVTDMYEMFYGCNSLTTLDVSGFNTSNVAGMGRMFGHCGSLTSLDVSGFDTSRVGSMGYMFDGCSHLTTLDVSGFNTSNVTTMEAMFRSCESLTSLDVSNFNTEKVTKMWDMFRGCGSLTSLDVSGFDTRLVTRMDRMFDGCSGLTSLDLSNFYISRVTDMSYMFNSCNLTTLDISNFDFSRESGTINTEYMFGQDLRPMLQQIDQMYGTNYCSVIFNENLSNYERARAAVVLTMLAQSGAEPGTVTSEMLTQLESQADDALQDPQMASQIDGLMTELSGGVIKKLYAPKNIGDETIALPAEYIRLDDDQTPIITLIANDLGNGEKLLLVQKEYYDSGEYASDLNGGSGDTPSTGVVTDIVLPSVAAIAIVIALAYVLKNKKKEQY